MGAEVKEEQDDDVEMKMDRRWWNRMGVNGSKNGSQRTTRWGRWRNGSGGRSEDEEEDNKNN